MEAMVGVGAAVGDVAVLVPLCPQAASSTNKKSNTIGTIRVLEIHPSNAARPQLAFGSGGMQGEEMTWERMVVLRDM